MDAKTKQFVLKKILGSKGFKGSAIYSDLLTYLVECSIKNEAPKEISIAIDVFHKHIRNETKDDLNIRVYVYNLRKKLSAYYQNDGRNEKIRLEIPKGHYEVRFISTNYHRITVKKYVPVIIIISLVLVIGIISYQIVRLKKRLTGFRTQIELASFFKSDPIWSDMLSSTTVITSSDMYHYAEFHNDTIPSVFIRDIHINSEEDLKKFRNKYPKKKELRKTDWIYFSDAGTFALPSIASLYGLVGQEHSFNAVSRITMDDIKGRNVVLLGVNKSLGVFKPLLENALNLQFVPSFIIADSIGKKELIPYAGLLKDYHNDKCMFIKVPGPDKRTWMFIISYRITGTLGIAQYITSPSSLKRFEQLLLEKCDPIPQYFLIVFDVLGYNLVAYKVEIKYFQPLDPNIKLW